MPPEDPPVVPPAPPVTPPAVPPAAAPVAPPAEDPAWLPRRLEQAARVAQDKLLADLGITDPAAAKAALVAANKAAEESKTAAQKLGETTKSLETSNAELARHRTVVADHATRQLGSLTAQQQAAVKAIAGDDAAAQLRTIDALRPTWAASSAPATPPGTPPAATPPAATPPAPPATTAPPAGSAPPANPPGSPPDHKAIYAELKKTNPVQAAQYLNRYSQQIYPPTTG